SAATRRAGRRGSSSTSHPAALAAGPNDGARLVRPGAPMRRSVQQLNLASLRGKLSAKGAREAPTALSKKGTPIMSTWKTARADTRLHTARANGWLYIQWHHGTDSRKDSIPEGGWEIERAKYPGLQLALPSGKVLH